MHTAIILKHKIVNLQTLQYLKLESCVSSNCISFGIIVFVIIKVYTNKL